MNMVLITCRITHYLSGIERYDAIAICNPCPFGRSLVSLVSHLYCHDGPYFSVVTRSHHSRSNCRSTLPFSSSITFSTVPVFSFSCTCHWWVSVQEVSSCFRSAMSLTCSFSSCKLTPPLFKIAEVSCHFMLYHFHPIKSHITRLCYCGMGY